MSRVTTTRVVSGGLWSLGWQGATLGASLVATPFVLRRLGPAEYGVLALVNLLIGYAAVSDLGMSQASTKFGAEAYGRDDRHEEAAVVWTSLLVLSVPTAAASLLLALTAAWIADYVLHVPAGLRPATVTALHLAAIALGVRSLAGVLNTPHLVRLRIDLVSGITNAGALAQIISVPVVLWWFDVGLAGAVAVIAGIAILVAVAHGFVACRLLPELSRPRIVLHAIRPLLSFGISTAVIVLLAIATMNAEKFLVAGLMSAGALAAYSVAFTLARLLAVLPGALGQVLLPAFAQLDVGANRRRLQDLYTRSLRGLLLVNMPLAALLAFSARPLLTLWAGPEYADASTLPLSILALGCLIDGLSFVPRILLESVGRPNLIARYLLLTLVPYLGVTVALIQLWGSVGAAVAWTLRAAVECWLMLRAAGAVAGMSLREVPPALWASVASLALLLAPAALIPWTRHSLATTVAVAAASVAAYAGMAWMGVLTREERHWALGYCGRMFGLAG